MGNTCSSLVCSDNHEKEFDNNDSNNIIIFPENLKEIIDGNGQKENVAIFKNLYHDQRLNAPNNIVGNRILMYVKDKPYKVKESHPANFYTDEVKQYEFENSDNNLTDNIPEISNDQDYCHKRFSKSLNKNLNSNNRKILSQDIDQITNKNSKHRDEKMKGSQKDNNDILFICSNNADRKRSESKDKKNIELKEKTNSIATNYTSPTLFSEENIQNDKRNTGDIFSLTTASNNFNGVKKKHFKNDIFFSKRINPHALDSLKKILQNNKYTDKEHNNDFMNSNSIDKFLKNQNDNLGIPAERKEPAIISDIRSNKVFYTSEYISELKSKLNFKKVQIESVKKENELLKHNRDIKAQKNTFLKDNRIHLINNPASTREEIIKHRRKNNIEQDADYINDTIPDLTNTSLRLNNVNYEICENLLVTCANSTIEDKDKDKTILNLDILKQENNKNISLAENQNKLENKIDSQKVGVSLNDREIKFIQQINNYKNNNDIVQLNEVEYNFNSPYRNSKITTEPLLKAVKDFTLENKVDLPRREFIKFDNIDTRGSSHRRNSSFSRKASEKSNNQWSYDFKAQLFKDEKLMDFINDPFLNQYSNRLK